MSRCPKCGKDNGPHFVPPSFGEAGFYVCDAAVFTDPPKQPEPATPDADAVARLVAEVEPIRHGCGDGSCMFVRPTGMHTNGGCRCLGERSQLKKLPAFHALLFRAIDALLAVQARAERAEGERDEANARADLNAHVCAMEGRTILSLSAKVQQLQATREGRGQG